ncbi:MAG: glycine C-acetyltransferase [Acidobacteriota bacterium]
MIGNVKEFLQREIKEVSEAGLYKEERIIVSPQGANISVRYPEKEPPKEVLNFCANNYLGLGNHPEIIAAAKEGLEKHGYGMSSVRFICGTQDIHKKLERTISEFLQTDDTILYSSCFDANGGLFETVLKEQDVVISDELNHASIIDGIRLSKAQRKVFKHGDMEDLEEKLKESGNFRFRMIATDGVFSMDGDIVKLDKICDLAEKYNSLVMVDDSHATGFLGKTGRGSIEFCNVMGRIDVITSTLGKAMGGASGGFTSGRKDIIEILRQRSRPYLFSNTLAPPIVYAAIKAFEMLSRTTELRDQLEWNTAYFREKMVQKGFKIKEGIHPIVPIMLGEAKLAQDIARDLYYEGIYVIGFFYPVVPKGQARIRVQISAAHTKEHLAKAIEAFKKVGKRYEII